MPRQARDNRLDTRTARLTLKPRREPYWKAVQAGRAIGYRRVTGGRAGAWIAKHINPDGGRKLRSIGLADDALLADGVATLTWAQAQERARAWWREIDRAAVPVVEAVRVRDAMTAYVADYRARGAAWPSFVKASLLTMNTALIVAGLIGIARAFTRPGPPLPGALLIAAPIVCIATVHLILFAAPRYQVPMMPFMLVFAGSLWQGPVRIE